MIQSGDFFELQSQLILAVIEVSVLKTFHRNKSEEAKHTMRYNYDGIGKLCLKCENTFFFLYLAKKILHFGVSCLKHLVAIGMTFETCLPCLSQHRGGIAKEELPQRSCSTVPLAGSDIVPNTNLGPDSVARLPSGKGRKELKFSPALQQLHQKQQQQHCKSATSKVTAAMTAAAASTRIA